MRRRPLKKFPYLLQGELEGKRNWGTVPLFWDCPHAEISSPDLEEICS